MPESLFGKGNWKAGESFELSLPAAMNEVICFALFVPIAATANAK
jgi:hypothetical protein